MLAASHHTMHWWSAYPCAYGEVWSHSITSGYMLVSFASKALLVWLNLFLVMDWYGSFSSGFGTQHVKCMYTSCTHILPPQHCKQNEKTRNRVQQQHSVKRCYIWEICKTNVHCAQDKLVLRNVLKEVRFLGMLVQKRWYSTGLTASIAQIPSFDTFQKL